MRKQKVAGYEKVMFPYVKQLDVFRAERSASLNSLLQTFEDFYSK